MTSYDYFMKQVSRSAEAFEKNHKREDTINNNCIIQSEQYENDNVSTISNSSLSPLSQTKTDTKKYKPKKPLETKTTEYKFNNKIYRLGIVNCHGVLQTPFLPIHYCQAKSFDRFFANANKPKKIKPWMTTAVKYKSLNTKKVMNGFVVYLDDNSKPIGGVILQN